MPLRPIEPTLRPVVRRRPEVLAPVGDHDSLRTALQSGADSVYFGLDEGFNARARATNFPLDRLPETIAQIHRAGARAYLTLNTLLFESEIAPMRRILRAVGEAGVDAIIVQDPAVALLAATECPSVDVHASTQMTISSPDGARFAATLGVTRVVVPRELSVTEIARFAEECPLELEVFIHGALCMSWSGQCLTSEAWGGRSANRGQCAQSCRMPYELVVDGEVKPTGDVRYLLSPSDLAGYRAVPALMEIGVHTLKIEGRLKGPAYVASTVRGLRSWLDAVEQGVADTPEAQQRLSTDLASMMVAYSRGFSDGFLAGSDHQTLVEGRFPKHRGAYVGRVQSVHRNEVVVRREVREARDGAGVVASPLPALGGSDVAASGAAIAPIVLRAGLGIGFDTGHPEDTSEPGGPLFGVRESDGVAVLTFGRPGPDLGRVTPGDRVWVTADPSLQQQAQRLTQAGEPTGRLGLRLVVSGAADAPLEVTATCGPYVARASSPMPLVRAAGPGLTPELVAEKLGAMGGTPFFVEDIDCAELDAGLHVAVSVLKQLRRELVDTLVPAIERRHPLAPPRPTVLPTLPTPAARGPIAPTRLVVLCRTPDQLEAVIAAGLPDVELDWMEMVGLGQAVARARSAGLTVTVATVRVQKPGEEGFDRRVEKLDPDAVLVRHWGALMNFAELPEGSRKPLLHGDFSLNVTNAITAHHLFGLGLDTLTAAHDLDEVQLFELLAHVPPERMTVTVHHHIATFHTEHCVYSHMLSQGRDFRTCGRPCEAHRVALRDHQGNDHPVIVDVGCRNTVFNAKAQSAASLVGRLAAAGVGRLRIEFVWETGAQAADVIEAYKALLDGRSNARQLVARVGVHEQFGVTAGTMQVLR